MLKQTSRLKAVLVLVLGVSLMCTGAFAQGDGNRGGDRRDNNRSDNRGDNRRDNRGNNPGMNRGGGHAENRGGRYHYRDGRWYGRGWFGWEFLVSALAIGAMVESLPPNHTVIVVGDTPYYYDNTTYYRQLPDGSYVVVRSPR